MLILDQDLADALCTVIACGFIDMMTPKPGVPTNHYTDFICEDGTDRRKYNLLSNTLAAVGISVTFKEPPVKAQTPFIMAKTHTTSDVLNGLQQDMKSWATALETKVNATTREPLRGAYLGGHSTISTTQILGVSDLYLYSPSYRKGDVDAYETELKRSYESARNVTNTIIQHLITANLYVRKHIQLTPDEQRPINDSYQKGLLFASIHGMTRSILRFWPEGRSDVHFELALGQDTCKVASCIPCSLLMAAVEQPATATHLGRGDNWNFPKNANKQVKDMWRNYVISCYNAGAKKLEPLETVSHSLSRWFQVVQGLNSSNSKAVPEMFLEALTYESSFMTKMSRVLALPA